MKREFKNVSRFMDRHGKLRWRARRKGKPTYYFKSPYGSDGFRAEYEAWVNGATISAGKAPGHGAVSDVIARYYKTTTWVNLAPTTQAMRRNMLERFREKHGDKSIATLQREDVKRWIEAKPPEAGKNFLKMLRALVRVAIESGLRKDDPTAGVETKKTRSDGFHSWTEEEIAAFEGAHPVGTRARLALALLLYTGQRRGDVIHMGRQHVREGRVHLTQSKTGTALAILIHPALHAVLEATPRDNLTFLVTQNGKPFSPAGFGNWFREMCTQAGLPARCSAHGLRKAAARRLAEAGATASEIAAVTGHASLREVERYTKAAAQVKLADAAMAKVARAEHEQKLANPETRLANSGDK